MRASRSGDKAISSPALEPKSKALNIAIPKEKMAYMTKKHNLHKFMKQLSFKL